MGQKKLLLEITESLLIKCDKPGLNKNISSIPLILLNAAYTWFILFFNKIYLFTLTRCFTVPDIISKSNEDFAMKQRSVI